MSGGKRVKLLRQIYLVYMFQILSESAVFYKRCHRNMYAFLLGHGIGIFTKNS